MQLVGMALVVTLLLSASAVVAAAQSEPPIRSDEGVRVVLADLGIGLTVPSGWTVTVDHRRADPPPDQPTPAAERWIMLTMADGSAELDGCRLFRYEATGMDLEAFVVALMSEQRHVATPVRLDAGEATRLDLDLGGSAVAQQYVIRSGDTYYQTACLRDEGLPDPRWLSIVESFELLPEEA
jgi:hypothetical protein